MTHERTQHVSVPSRLLQALVTLALVLSVAGATRAQTIQRTLAVDPKSGWKTFVVGSNDPEKPLGDDPKSLVAGADGKVYVLAKKPFEGPPRQGYVASVSDKGLDVLGAVLDEDPGALLDAPGGLLFAGKGTVMERHGTLFGFDGTDWSPRIEAPVSAELFSLAVHRGAVVVGTKGDGVMQLSGSALERVGATTTVLEEGYFWTSFGDYSGEVEAIVRRDDGAVVSAGKDFRVLVFEGDSHTELPDLTDAMFDAEGVLVSARRELKAVAVCDGQLYVGTKGREGSPEGKDRGALFRLDEDAWTRVGNSDAMQKEVKAIVCLGGGKLALGTNESGVFLWDGETFSQKNEGLASSMGKTKGEKLVRGADGALYVAQQNSLLRRASLDGGSWQEVGFFELGEQIEHVAVSAAGTVFVGAKVGASSGAVYRLGESGTTDWTQLGEDLSREVKRLVLGADESLYALLGAGAGALVWEGNAWTSILGALTGAPAELKDLIALDDGSFVAGTKAGLLTGVFREEPQTIVESALGRQEIIALLSLGDSLFAATKAAGIYRLVADAAGDDGQGWAEGARGLPQLDIETVEKVSADTALVVGKKLLYRARLAADGLLDVVPMGKNPGAAMLDGNGDVVYVGETELKSAALDPANELLYVGTNDGLFVSENSGETYAAITGPAEVKDVVLAGEQLVLVAKESEYIDANDPTAKVDRAVVAVFAAAEDGAPPETEPEVDESIPGPGTPGGETEGSGDLPEPASGCALVPSASNRGALGVGLAVMVFAWSRRRRRP
jgi:hypothetical protein